MRRAPARTRALGGFTLIELMVTLALVGVLAAIALPSYRQHAIRSSRQAVQAELLEAANTQERIYLNANAFSSSLSAAYTGDSAGGLGITSGLSRDRKYTLTLATATASYTLTATPLSSGSQSADGTITLTATGQRSWNGGSW